MITSGFNHSATKLSLLLFLTNSSLSRLFLTELAVSASLLSSPSLIVALLLLPLPLLVRVDGESSLLKGPTYDSPFSYYLLWVSLPSSSLQNFLPVIPSGIPPTPVSIVSFVTNINDLTSEYTSREAATTYNSHCLYMDRAFTYPSRRYGAYS